MARSSVSLHFSNSPLSLPPFPLDVQRTRSNNVGFHRLHGTLSLLRSYLQPNRCTLDGLIFVSTHLPVSCPATNRKQQVLLTLFCFENNNLQEENSQIYLQFTLRSNFQRLLQFHMLYSSSNHAP